jgi:hypothetical protein
MEVEALNRRSLAKTAWAALCCHQNHSAEDQSYPPYLNLDVNRK